MKRPNFFIVGAPKCGTTAWVEYLATHPDIAFSKDKEPHYFNTDFPGFRWAKSEEEYLAQFEHVSGEACVGEASVQYLYSEDAARNIAAFAPDAKILIFLREPVSFLRSYHNQLLLNLDENIADFSKAWALSGQRNSNTLPETCREPKLLDYKRVGQFAEQIERYRQHFPENQIKIMWFDDWKSDPRAAYLELLAFLGLEDDGRTEFPVVHGAKRNASELVSKIIQRPPSWALGLARMIKRMLRLKRLGVAGKIRKLNTRQGYAKTGQDETLEQEIKAFFDADYQALRNPQGAAARMG